MQRFMRFKNAKQIVTATDHCLYLWLLCKSRLDSYVCFTCNDVHDVDLLNLPRNRRIICPKEHSEMIHGSSLTGFAQYDHGHVQMACKLSQTRHELLGPHHKIFLDRVLSPYSLFVLNPSIPPPGKPDYADTELQARMYVIRGKCILKRVWRVDYGADHGGDMDQIFGGIQICPHENTSARRGLLDPFDHYQRSNLRRLARAVWESTYADGGYSYCSDCTTDFGVLMKANGFAALVVCQTLGSADFDESHQLWEEHGWQAGVPLRRNISQVLTRTTLSSYHLVRSVTHPNINRQ